MSNFQKNRFLAYRLFIHVTFLNFWYLVVLRSAFSIPFLYLIGYKASACTLDTTGGEHEKDLATRIKVILNEDGVSTDSENAQLSMCRPKSPT